MSHEIRTPINAVLGLDEMILRESTEPQIQSYAHDIQSSGKSLLSIINDILDFSKIEAGKMEIIPVDYDLSTTISDLVNMIQTRAEKKGLRFIVNIDPKMPHRLHGDETRIKQCILNILTNAVKYTPAGSVTMNIGAISNAKGEVSPSLQPASQSSATPSNGGCTPVTPLPLVPGAYTEFMQIFRARNFAGSLRTDCPEGDLEWVPLAKLKDLPHWQADEIFYDFLAENHPFYSLKVIYKDNILQKVYLAGKPYDHWASLPKDATSN